MTNKERILKTLAFEPTDRTPFAVLNGHMWICAREGLTAAGLLGLPDAGAKLLVDAYREIGTDIMTSACDAAWVMISVMGGRVDMDRLAAEILTHPLAELSDIDRYDVRKVIADMRQDPWYLRMLEQLRNMRALVGDETMIAGGFFGPFTLAAQMMGVENFMVEMMDSDEDDIRKLIDFCAEISVASLEDFIDNGLDLITIPEPVASGDLIRPSVFEQLVLPADVRVKERLSARCPNCLIHICGRTDKLVASVAGARMGVFSVDSIDMVQAQKDAAKRCALFGNLSPAEVLVAKPADEVYRISRELCEQMKPYGGFILAPGCDLAPNIPPENLQAMARAAREA